MKRLLLFASLVLLPGLLWAPVSEQLNIEETDGSPSTFPYKLKVSAGSLTDNGDGTATLSTSVGSATDLLPGDTDYIQNTGTLQSGARFHVSTGAITSGTLPQLSIFNPNFAGSYSSQIGLGFNGTPYGYLQQSNSNFLCSDLSTVCMTTPFSYGSSTSNGLWAVDANGKMSVGAYTGSRSTATIWGNLLLGSGYSTITNAPIDGLRVQGNVIFDSSASVNGGNGMVVAYGLTAATVTVNDDAYGAGWNGSLLVPTKNALYDKIETISAGGGGASTLQVTLSGVEITSPTGSINLYSGDFGGVGVGATAQIILNPNTTNFIHNQTTLQAATFFVASGTVHQEFSASSITFLNFNSMMRHRDKTPILSMPDIQTMYLGYGSGIDPTQGGTFNTCVGAACMASVTTGNFNTGLGNSVLTGVLSGEQNNCIGYAACAAMTSGSYNNAMGGSALTTLTTGINNTAVGTIALNLTTNGNNNTAAGFQSLQYNTVGGTNTAIGYQAGIGTAPVNASRSGGGNTFLGANTGQSLSSSTIINDSIAIGRNALVEASNIAQIGARAGSVPEVMVRTTSMTIEGLTASQFVKTNSSKMFVSQASINDTEMAAEDFGSFTCTGSEDGCTLDADSVGAGELASTAIQSGDIEAGDLPADGYASTYVNVTGDTMTGQLTNRSSMTVTGAGLISSFLTVSGTATVGGQSICLEDGTDCPVSGAADNLGNGTGNFGVHTTTGGFTGAAGVNVTYGTTVGSITVNNLTASRFVISDSNKMLASQETINDTDLTAEDFGDFTCDSNEDGCTLDADVVGASELASTAIESGDIEAGDLPADGYASTYVNVTGDTMTGQLTNTSSLTVTGASLITSFLVVGGTATINGQSPCLEDGTDCPAAGAGDMILASTQTVTAHKTFTSSVTINTAFRTSTATVTTYLDVQSSDHGANMVRLDPNATAGTSTSVGGAVLLENTGNAGAGMVIYSNNAAPTGRLVNIRADNAAFSQPAVHVDYDGTANAFEILCIQAGGAGDSSSNCLNVVSTNTLDTALGISGRETGKGTLKVTHNNPFAPDGNASAISIDVAGAGTDAQGIFLDATSGTTGKLLNIRNSGNEYLVVYSTTASGVHKSGLEVSTASVTSNLRIPNGTSPTLDTTGEIALDTTDNALLLYDGVSTKVLAHSTHSFTVTISSGAGWNGLSFPVWRAPHDMAVTITKIQAETLTAGTTVMFQLDETTFGGTGAAGTDVFSVAFSSAHNQGVTTASFANAEIAAQSSLVFNTTAGGAAGGAPAGLNFTVYYLKNRE